MQQLEDLFVKYGTDKGILEGNGWGYTQYYFEAMAARRFEVKRVLEIGICGYRNIPNNVVGASLFVWRDFFPNAEIYGIDNDSRFIFNDQSRIHTALCDAYDERALHAVLDRWANPDHPFDMIVDDAVHDPVNQVVLMNSLQPYLREDGRYFIEDVGPEKITGGDFPAFLKANTTYHGWQGFHVCVTHKPEELLLAVK